MITILATSDIHGKLPMIQEPFDLLLIGGDICPAHDHYYDFQTKWFVTVFVPWINSLPFKDETSKVFMIWGNHDYLGVEVNCSWRKRMTRNTDGRLVFLCHDSYDFEYPVSDGIDALRVFGTSYCTWFGHWAFMVDNEVLEQKFSEIPEGLDILLSHDSPHLNNLGAITEGRHKTHETGSRILAKHVKRAKPKIFLSGHFHSGNHKFEEVDGTYMANVSLVNEWYEPVNPILKIEYDGENRKIIGHNFL